MKVFSLESFPLYGAMVNTYLFSISWIYHLHHKVIDEIAMATTSWLECTRLQEFYFLMLVLWDCTHCVKLWEYFTTILYLLMIIGQQEIALSLCTITTKLGPLRSSSIYYQICKFLWACSVNSNIMTKGVMAIMPYTGFEAMGHVSAVFSWRALPTHKHTW